MYTVTITEHFEDWYVADEAIGAFETFDEAIRTFTEACALFQASRQQPTALGRQFGLLRRRCHGFKRVEQGSRHEFTPVNENMDPSIKRNKRNVIKVSGPYVAKIAHSAVF
jgi:hypothetical protein